MPICEINTVKTFSLCTGSSLAVEFWYMYVSKWKHALILDRSGVVGMIDCMEWKVDFS